MRALLLCLALLLAACSPPPRFDASELKGVDWGRELSLTGHDGKPHTRADFKGRAVILFSAIPSVPTSVRSR